MEAVVYALVAIAIGILCFTLKLPLWAAPLAASFGACVMVAALLLLDGGSRRRQELRGRPVERETWR